jgi:hypothetical protein
MGRINHATAQRTLHAACGLRLARQRGIPAEDADARDVPEAARGVLLASMPDLGCRPRRIAEMLVQGFAGGAFLRIIGAL